MPGPRDPQGLDIERETAAAIRAFREAEIAAGKTESELEHEREQSLLTMRRIKGRSDFQQMLIHPQFRRIMARLVEIGKPFAPTFDRDAIVMANKEGRRFASTELLKMLEDAERGSTLKIQREYESNLLSEQRETQGQGE